MSTSLLYACSPSDPQPPRLPSGADSWVLQFDAGGSTPASDGLILRPKNQPFDIAFDPSLEPSQERLQQTFLVWTESATLPADRCQHPVGKPSVLGRIQLNSRGLEFKPRLGFAPEMTYTACVDGDALAEVLPQLWKQSPFKTKQLVFTTPATTAEPPRITAVWPIANDVPIRSSRGTSATSNSLSTQNADRKIGRVPENLLRLYVFFSEPMEARAVSGKIKIVNPGGTPITEAFVDIPDGLWDQHKKRLTLFLHPGRIKRDLGPRKTLGAALHAGEEVSLVIDGTLRSQRGQPLRTDTVIAFAVDPPDRRSPDPTRWHILPPRTSTGRVTVSFDEPLDRAQLQTFAVVLDTNGNAVEGVASHTPDGRSWSFSPVERWKSSRYLVVARSSIEDLAGNSPRRLFDAKTTIDTAATSVTAMGTEEPIEMAFTPTIN